MLSAGNFSSALINYYVLLDKVEDVRLVARGSHSDIYFDPRNFVSRDILGHWSYGREKRFTGNPILFWSDKSDTDVCQYLQGKEKIAHWTRKRASSKFWIGSSIKLFVPASVQFEELRNSRGHTRPAEDSIDYSCCSRERGSIEVAARMPDGFSGSCG